MNCSGPPPGLPCFDAHVHLHPPRLAAAIERWFTGANWRLAQPFEPEAVADTLAARGVRGFCFFSYAHRAGMAAPVNRWLAAAARQLPGAIALGTLHPDDPDVAAVAAEAVDDLGLPGFKFHLSVQRFYADDRRLAPVFERGQAEGHRFVLHAGTLPYRDQFTGAAGFERLLARYPRLRVCVAHMGAFETPRFLELTERFEGLMLDTTMAMTAAATPYVGAEPGVVTDEMLMRYQDRIVFGSDFPLTPYDYDEERRWAWGRLPEDVLRRLFHDNAARFFGLAAAPGMAGPPAPA